MSTTSVPYLDLPRDQRLAALDRHRFPPISQHDRTLVAEGWTLKHLFRKNRVLIRPYQPKGLTPGGVYLERSEKWPTIFAHVLAINDEQAIIHNILPGDMVCIKHLTEDMLYEEKPQSPRYIGETVEVAIIHINSIRFVFEPAPVEFKP